MNEAFRSKAHETRRLLSELSDSISDLLQIDQASYGHPHQWYGGVSYSQHGEDLVFVDVFHRLGITQPTYLDIGAHHPTVINNTALLYSRGATGVNVDAHPHAIETFNRARPRDKNFNLGVGPTRSTMTFYFYDGEAAGRSTFSRQAIDQLLELYPNMAPPEEMSIEVVTLDDMIETYCGGVFPDLLSLDAEYLDQEILKSTSFDRWRPKLMCVEVLSPDGDSSQEVASIVATKGFVPYVRMGGNLILIDRDLEAKVTGLSCAGAGRGPAF